MPIKYYGNPAKVFTNLARMTKELFVDGKLTRDIRQVHELAQAQARLNLLNRAKSIKSNPSELPMRELIARSITVAIYRRTTKITGGVGDVQVLDATDPLLLLQRPVRTTTSNPEQRLWRILELGTKKKYYPITAKNAPVLHYRIQPGGAYIKKRTVVHPGQPGFRYFSEVAHWFGNYYFTMVKVLLGKIIRKYSYGR